MEGCNCSRYLRRIENYDVVSFDIFDTLLMRPYANPSDLWMSVGKVHNLPDFAYKRYQAEVGTRQSNPQLGDINLDMIY